MAHTLPKHCAGGHRGAIFPTLCSLIVACPLSLQLHTVHAASSGEDRPVSRQELLEAMRPCTDYDPTATTNGPRFQAEVLLRLARQARAQDPEGPPLFVGHEDWFEAFLEVTGRTIETAPLYALLAYQHEQRLEVEYRNDRVITKVKKGPGPELAVNVALWWPSRPGGPSQYSYWDTLSAPRLKVTNHRLITYRLLDFGDRIVYDEIEGLTGRPTSGILGFLFRIIGEGCMVHSRMAISRDGLQVSRATAEKAFFKITTTVTVYPDGRTEKDVPASRPDLLALEALLEQPLEIDYVRIVPENE